MEYQTTYRNDHKIGLKLEGIKGMVGGPISTTLLPPNVLVGIGNQNIQEIHSIVGIQRSLASNLFNKLRVIAKGFL